jgi:hypothetical protein
MQTSIFLARLIGPALLLAGLGMLLNQKYYRAMAMQAVKNTPVIYIVSVIGVVAGTAVLLFHNLWVADWRVIITLLAWLNLLRGAFTLIAPEAATDFAARTTRNKNMALYSGLFAAVIGATLVYFGYLQGMMR